MSKKFNADDGFTEITVDTATGPHTTKLDLFESNNRYAILCDTHPDPIERATAWCEWLTTKGMPPISHGLSFQIAAAIMDDVAAYKKKAGRIWESADSPASTVSTPSS